MYNSCDAKHYWNTRENTTYKISIYTTPLSQAGTSSVCFSGYVHLSCPCLSGTMSAATISRGSWGGRSFKSDVSGLILSWAGRLEVVTCHWDWRGPHLSVAATFPVGESRAVGTWAWVVGALVSCVVGLQTLLVEQVINGGYGRQHFWYLCQDALFLGWQPRHDKLIYGWPGYLGWLVPLEQLVLLG